MDKCVISSGVVLGDLVGYAALDHLLDHQGFSNNCATAFTFYAASWYILFSLKTYNNVTYLPLRIRGSRKVQTRNVAIWKNYCFSTFVTACEIRRTLLTNTV
jgi:hypothetical protein